MTDPTRPHLLLLGAGHAHVHVLARLAKLSRRQREKSQITLVSPYPWQIYSGMLPGFVAGHYALDECTIQLDALIKASGVNYIQGRVSQIDAGKRSVTVLTQHGRQTLGYNVMSLDTGAIMNRQRLETAMPGAQAHAFFLRPIEAFVHQWQSLMERAESRSLQIAVIGAGAGGVEIAMAIKHRLPRCTVSLVMGADVPVATHAPGVQRSVLHALQSRDIQVLTEKCVGIAADHIQLDNSRSLPCDAALLLVGVHAPPWLANSGLTLDGNGFLAVNTWQQSLSHHEVFGAGDVTSRVDYPHAKSGVYAVRASAPLATNLLAALRGKALKAYRPQTRALSLLACGEPFAIVSWGGIHAKGVWAWKWKNRIDRAFITKYDKKDSMGKSV